MTQFYIVSGFRDSRVQGQWVIEATAASEACLIAERRQAGIANFDTFEAEPDDDHLFDAEENLTEEPVQPGAAEFYRGFKE